VTSRWQRHSRRLWPALGFAVAGDAVLGLCVIAASLAGVCGPESADGSWLPITIGGVVATGLFGLAGFIIAGWVLEPVRETVELARRLASRPGPRQIPIMNPHDELGELETLLNEMFARLEGSFVELDRLAADASHELRTPLTAMRAVGEVALHDRNPAILYDAVGSMLEEIRRMNQLIDRLLLLTRVDSDKWPVRPKPGSIRPVLLEVNDILAMVAEEKQQRLEVDCPEPVRATFDAALLRLALMNLVQNAIRYSPRGKTITLRGVTKGDSVLIEVADEGPGIAPEHREKIFARLYRVEVARSRAEGGVGLGLAIVKWAVGRTGGTVELESEVGRGSVFRVRLPKAGA